MKMFGKLIEKTVKVVGTVSKVGVELGADLVGTVAEKIDDNPEVKKKYSDYGKKAGSTIKKYTENAAKSAGEAVDVAVDYSVSSIGKISSQIVDKAGDIIGNINNKKSTWEANQNKYEENQDPDYSETYPGGVYTKTCSYDSKKDMWDIEDTEKSEDKDVSEFKNEK